MSVFGNHEAALVASMDCAVDDLLDALNDADQLGAWSVPVHRRSADQDEAVIRVQDAQEAAEEYMRCSSQTGMGWILWSSWRRGSCDGGF